MKKLILLNKMAEPNSKIGIIYSSNVLLEYDQVYKNYRLGLVFEGENTRTLIGNECMPETLVAPIWSTPLEFLGFFINTKLLTEYKVIYTDIYNKYSYFETRNKA